MAHETAEVCPATPGQVGSHVSLGFSTLQLDLDKFVIRQRTIERCEHSIAHPGLSDGDDGFPAVGQLAQMPPLRSCEGFEGEGHGFVTLARPLGQRAREVRLGALPDPYDSHPRRTGDSAASG